MHRFGERADGLPLVGYGVVPGEEEEQVSEHHFRGMPDNKYGPKCV